MKRISLLILVGSMLLPFLSYAQQATKRWSHQTAYLEQKGKWESGILQPFRYGINSRLEVSTYAFLLPLMPNAGVKLSYGVKSGYALASEHSLSVPSAFLNMVSRKGTGGILSPQFDFPFMLGLNNSPYASKTVLDSCLLTWKLGFGFTMRSDEVDPLATIDLPVFYPRMATYYKGLSIRAGADVRKSLSKRFDIQEGFQFFLITRTDNNFFFENTGNILWSAGKSLRIKAGYNLSYGTYPFGNHWQLWPSIDIIFGSRIR